jgi:hypothetical protein
VLVRVTHSVINIGTEEMTVDYPPAARALIEPARRGGSQHGHLDAADDGDLVSDIFRRQSAGGKVK